MKDEYFIKEIDQILNERKEFFINLRNAFLETEQREKITTKDKEFFTTWCKIGEENNKLNGKEFMLLKDQGLNALKISVSSDRSDIEDSLELIEGLKDQVKEFNSATVWAYFQAKKPFVLRFFSATKYGLNEVLKLKGV
jgi:hypothetical protein